MHVMKRSLSRKAPEQTENPQQQASSEDLTSGGAAGSRTSADNFVIPGRTRLPSSSSPNTRGGKNHYEVPQQSLTPSLSQHDGTDSSIHPHPHPLTASQLLEWQRDPKSGPLTRAKTSHQLRQDTCTQVNPPLSGASGSTYGIGSVSSPALTTHFFECQAQNSDELIDEYNKLATDSCLCTLPKKGDNDTDNWDLTEHKNRSLRWYRSIFKRDVSFISAETSKSRGLHRKSSMSSMFSRQKGISMLKNLENICRIGGVSVLDLPPTVASKPLILPSCLAATAKYLLRNARNVDGIFRIPGQAGIVQKLYDHYSAHFNGTEDSEALIHTTVASPMLPKCVDFRVHDVASTFKKLLADMPGGILGSLCLFDTLHDIDANFAFPRNHPPTRQTVRVFKAHLIALALLTQTSAYRIDLICAIFGLLCFLKQDIEDFGSDENTFSLSPRKIGSDTMNSEALGVVFGPLLMGDLSDQIELGSPTNNFRSIGTDSRLKRSLFNHLKPSKSFNSAKKKSTLEKSVKHAKKASAIAEMMIRHWPDIIERIRALEAQSKKLSRPLSSHHLAANAMPRNICARERFQISRVSPPFNSRHDCLSHPQIVPSRRSSKSVNWSIQPITNEQDSLSTCPDASPSLQDHPNHVSEWLLGQANAPSRFMTPAGAFPYPSEKGRSNFSLDTRHNTGRREAYSNHGMSGSITKGIQFSNSNITHPETDRKSSASTNQSTVVITSTNDANEPGTLHDQQQTVKSQLEVPDLNLNGHEREFQPNLSSSDNGSHPPGRQKLILDTNLSLSDLHQAPLSHSDYSTGSSCHSHGTRDVFANDSIVKPWQEKAMASHATKKLSPSRIPQPTKLTSDTKQRPSTSPLAVRRKSVAEIVATLRLPCSHTSFTESHEPSRQSEPRNIVSSSSESAKTADTTFGLRESLPALHLPKVTPPQLAVDASISPQPQGKSPLRMAQLTRSRSVLGPHENIRVNRPAAKANIVTLHKEIDRLRSELSMRHEENNQLKQELSTFRDHKGAVVLNQQLRAAERDAEFWKSRAKWAENGLFTKVLATKHSLISPRDDEHKLSNLE